MSAVAPFQSRDTPLVWCRRAGRATLHAPGCSARKRGEQRTIVSIYVVSRVSDFLRAFVVSPTTNVPVRCFARGTARRWSSSALESRPLGRSQKGPFALSARCTLRRHPAAHGVCGSRQRARYDADPAHPPRCRDGQPRLRVDPSRSRRTTFCPHPVRPRPWPPRAADDHAEDPL